MRRVWWAQGGWAEVPSCGGVRGFRPLPYTVKWVPTYTVYIWDPLLVTYKRVLHWTVYKKEAKSWTLLHSKSHFLHKWLVRTPGAGKPDPPMFVPCWWPPLRECTEPHCPSLEEGGENEERNQWSQLDITHFLVDNNKNHFPEAASVVRSSRLAVGRGLGSGRGAEACHALPAHSTLGCSQGNHGKHNLF